MTGVSGAQHRRETDLRRDVAPAAALPQSNLELVGPMSSYRSSVWDVLDGPCGHLQVPSRARNPSSRDEEPSCFAGGPAGAAVFLGALSGRCGWRLEVWGAAIPHEVLRAGESLTPPGDQSKEANPTLASCEGVCFLWFVFLFKKN